jgi:hypothetical protein
MSKKPNESTIPKSLFNPAINRQLLDQHNCPWDELDINHLKICILKDGTSPATLSKYLPWRSRKNIERKVKYDDIKLFITQMKVDSGRETQLRFDENLKNKKRKFEKIQNASNDDVEDDDDNEYSDEIPEGDSRVATNSNYSQKSREMNRFLQRPRVDITPTAYYVSFRHSLATEVKWFIVDVDKRYLECEFKDPAWCASEWQRHPACQFSNFVNSDKQNYTHVVPFQAPRDSNLGNRSAAKSFTETGCITILTIPRATNNEPGEVPCDTVFTNI